MIALYLSPPIFPCFDVTSDIENLYRHFMRMTNDPQAASTLTLSHVNAGKAPPMEKLLTTEEAANILNVSLSLVQAMAADGRLRHVRMGKLIRFKREWLEADAMTPDPEPGRHW